MFVWNLSALSPLHNIDIIQCPQLTNSLRSGDPSRSPLCIAHEKWLPKNRIKKNSNMGKIRTRSVSHLFTKSSGHRVMACDPWPPSTWWHATHGHQAPDGMRPMVTKHWWHATHGHQAPDGMRPMVTKHLASRNPYQSQLWYERC